MSKYPPLRDYLMSLKTDRWHASFSEIEDVLEFCLPASANKYQAWWANEQSGSHSHCRSWMDSGFLVEDLHLLKRRVTFVRVRS